MALEDRVVPATLYIDPTIMGSTGDSVTFNAGRNGAVSGLTLGSQAFQDLNSAYTASSSGDVLRLAETTIATDVDFTLNKTLQIIGSGVGLTTVTPNADTVDDLGTNAAWFKVVSGARVDFSQMTFNGLSSSFGIGEAVRYESSSGTVSSVVMANIARDIVGSQYQGVGVVAKSSTVSVLGSTFANIGRSGAVFTDVGTVGIFRDNTYLGKGPGDFLDNGIEVSFGASALVTGNRFTNCLGIASADGSLSTGMIVADPGTHVTAIGNTFSNNRVGVIAGFELNDTATLILNYNNISGNVEGLRTSIAEGSNVDARFNFFGSSSGPNAAGQNRNGSGDIITDINGATILGPFLRAATPVASAVSSISYVTLITPPEIYAVGAGVGGDPHVKVYQNGQLILSFYAYTVGFTGGVRVATADVDGDGVVDIITATGPGGGPHVKVFDSATGAEKLSFFAYVSTFSGGVNIAVGDVDGDGIADIITGAGAGGGPHVKVFDGRTGAEKLSFFAYVSTFTGGVTVGSGDINNDFIDEIITGAGSGGGPHVKIFDGLTATELSSFYAFAANFSQGVNVAAGDTDRDGIAEIFVGTGLDTPVVNVFSPDGTLKNSFLADAADSASGVRVTGVDLHGDGIKLLLFGNGANRPSNFRFLDPLTGMEVLNDTAFGVPLPGGIFVG